MNSEIGPYLAIDKYSQDRSPSMSLDTGQPSRERRPQCGTNRIDPGTSRTAKNPFFVVFIDPFGSGFDHCRVNWGEGAGGEGWVLPSPW